MKTFNYLRKYLFRFKPLKTIYINFKFLPFQEAIKLPILLFGKIKFGKLNGKIIFNCPIKFATVKFGTYDCPLNGYESGISRFSIDKGTVIINGMLVIGSEFRILVNKNGILSFGKNNLFNHKLKIACANRITLSDNILASWNVQIIDNDFHYIVEKNQSVRKNSNDINIGHTTWIGNNSTISKGSKINNMSIIASHSLVNKDFSNYGEKKLLAGIPANIVSNEVFAILDPKKEAIINQYFENQNKTILDLNNFTNIFE